MVADVVAAVCSILGSTIDLEQPLMEAGLDSLGAIELRNSLSSLFGIELPATITLDYPTAAALANYISAQGPQHDELGVASLVSWASSDGSEVSTTTSLQR